MEFQWIFGPATATTVDDMSDVVVRVDWICLLNDTNGGEWKNSGQVETPPINPEDFVPFDQITKEIVEGWVFAVVDKQLVESTMQLDYEASQKIQVLPFNF
jgi:hypothetical protein